MTLVFKHFLQNRCHLNSFTTSKKGRAHGTNSSSPSVVSVTWEFLMSRVTQDRSFHGRKSQSTLKKKNSYFFGKCKSQKVNSTI